MLADVRIRKKRLRNQKIGFGAWAALCTLTVFGPVTAPALVAGSCALGLGVSAWNKFRYGPSVKLHPDDEDKDRADDEFPMSPYRHIAADPSWRQIPGAVSRARNLSRTRYL